MHKAFLLPLSCFFVFLSCLSSFAFPETHLGWKFRLCSWGELKGTQTLRYGDASVFLPYLEPQSFPPVWNKCPDAMLWPCASEEYIYFHNIIQNASTKDYLKTPSIILFDFFWEVTIYGWFFFIRHCAVRLCRKSFLALLERWQFQKSGGTTHSPGKLCNHLS